MKQVLWVFVFCSNCKYWEDSYWGKLHTTRSTLLRYSVSSFERTCRPYVILYLLPFTSQMREDLTGIYQSRNEVEYSLTTTGLHLKCRLMWMSLILSVVAMDFVIIKLAWKDRSSFKNRCSREKSKSKVSNARRDSWVIFYYHPHTSKNNLQVKLDKGLGEELVDKTRLAMSS